MNPAPKHTMLNVLINHECEWYLREASIFQDTSVTEIIRQSIRMHKYFNDLVAAGYEITLRNKDTGEHIGFDEAVQLGIPSRFDIVTDED